MPRSLDHPQTELTESVEVQTTDVQLSSHFSANVQTIAVPTPADKSSNTSEMSIRHICALELGNIQNSRGLTFSKSCAVLACPVPVRASGLRHDGLRKGDASNGPTGRPRCNLVLERALPSLKLGP